MNLTLDNILQDIICLALIFTGALIDKICEHIIERLLTWLEQAWETRLTKIRQHFFHAKHAKKRISLSAASTEKPIHTDNDNLAANTAQMPYDRHTIDGMATTTIRMNDELKARASAVLESMGLNFNTFVNMASVQLVNQKRIPFDIIEPGSTAPAVGHTAANSIRFECTSDDGYPIVAIPSGLVFEPRRSKDGTAVLPKEWKDDAEQ